MDLTSMSDEQILDVLLAADPESMPTKEVVLKRLGIPVTLRALDEDVIERMRKKATYTVKGRRGEEKRIDDQQFGLSLVYAGTIKPDWGAEQLIAKYKASGPEQVIKRILLPGEISRLADIILELSGYGEDAVDELKNESVPEV